MGLEVSTRSQVFERYVGRALLPVSPRLTGRSARPTFFDSARKLVSGSLSKVYSIKGANRLRQATIIRERDQGELPGRAGVDLRDVAATLSIAYSVTSYLPTCYRAGRVRSADHDIWRVVRGAHPTATGDGSEVRFQGKKGPVGVRGKEPQSGEAWVPTRSMGTRKSRQTGAALASASNG